MRYWLMKSEPDCFSIDDLKNQKVAPWDGVRNYQVRNMLRDEMQVGDQAFFYHSNATPPGIAGLMEIVRAGYPDSTAFDPKAEHFDPKSDPANPRWYMVDVKFKRKFPRLLSLEALRQHPELHTLQILRKGSRLSITPLSAKEWQLILDIIG